MLINLYDVVSVPGKEKTVHAALDCQEAAYFGERFRISANDQFGVVLKHMDKDVVSIETSLDIEVVRSCSRCLEDVTSTYHLEVERLVNVEKAVAYTDEEENDEISYIEDCTLDVDMLILDELYTVLPMNVLCKEDCKGICKVCGINLNKSTCNCDQTVPDPRMAVFSDIFNQFKEV